jgi:hypothetical protein
MRLWEGQNQKEDGLSGGLREKSEKAKTQSVLFPFRQSNEEN